MTSTQNFMLSSNLSLVFQIFQARKTIFMFLDVLFQFFLFCNSSSNFKRFVLNPFGTSKDRDFDIRFQISNASFSTLSAPPRTGISTFDFKFQTLRSQPSGHLQKPGFRHSISNFKRFVLSPMGTSKNRDFDIRTQISNASFSAQSAPPNPGFSTFDFKS